MRKVLYSKTIVTKPVQVWESSSVTFSEIENKGYFHQFVIVEEDNYALIETEDGLVVPIRSDRFKFIDSPEVIDWEQRRYEIAKQLYSNNDHNGVICAADKLIKALKGEEE